MEIKSVSIVFVFICSAASKTWKNLDKMWYRRRRNENIGGCTHAKKKYTYTYKCTQIWVSFIEYDEHITV